MNNIIIAVIIQLFIILGIIIFLLIRNFKIKEKKYLEIIRKQTEYLLAIYDAVTLAENKIIEIDKAQIFQSDDDIGWYFKLIKDIQSQLFEFTKYIK